MNWQKRRSSPMPTRSICSAMWRSMPRFATRRERADRLRTERKDFFEKYAPEARRILEELLEKYTKHGTAQFVIPEILEVPPLSEHGNVMEIASTFGGVDKLREAILELQTLLYAAA